MQTLREVLMDSVPLRLGCREGAAMHDFWNWLADSPIGDLTIIDGAAVAMDVEAGAKALEACHSKPMNRGITRGIVSAILAACNIVVPDEVVELTVDDKARCELMTDGRLATVARLNPGESVFVTRKSILHPPVKEGE